MSVRSWVKKPGSLTSSGGAGSAGPVGAAGGALALGTGFGVEVDGTGGTFCGPADGGGLVGFSDFDSSDIKSSVFRPLRPLQRTLAPGIDITHDENEQKHDHLD